MKLFKDMSREEKLAKVKEYHAKLPDLFREYLTCPMADLWDWHDDWVPWLIRELEEAWKREN